MHPQDKCIHKTSSCSRQADFQFTEDHGNSSGIFYTFYLDSQNLGGYVHELNVPVFARVIT